MERIQTPFELGYSSGMPAAWLLLALLLQVDGGAGPQDASISGRVTDKVSGQPLPRMIVTLYTGDPAKQIEAVTDKDGRYRIDGVGPGKYAIGAAHEENRTTYLRQWFGRAEPGYPFNPPPPPNLEVAAGESRADVDFALTRALAIEGHVLDPFGGPLRNVGVALFDANDRPLPARGSTSDDLGAYRIFGLPPGHYRVCVGRTGSFDFPAAADGSTLARTCYPTSPGPATAADVGLTTLDASNIDITVQWSAAPTSFAVGAGHGSDVGQIRGRIVEKETGHPIASALVYLQSRAPTQDHFLTSTLTDEDGWFTFSALRPGQYHAFAAAAQHNMTSLSDGEGRFDLTVRTNSTLQSSAALARSFAITVRLVDAFDDPLSDVGVGVGTVDGNPIAPSFMHRTDDLGRVRLPGIAPGAYIICAEPEHGTTHAPVRRDRIVRTCFRSAPDNAQAEPIVVANADVEDTEIRVQRGRAVTLSGTMLDAFGAPAADARASLVKYERGSSHSVSFDVDRAGHFQVRNVTEGIYAIEAWRGGELSTGPQPAVEEAFAEVRVDTADIENLVVTLRQTVDVHGRFAIDDASANIGERPNYRMVGIEVHRAGVSRLNAETRLTETGNDGSFTFRRLIGRWTFDAPIIPPGWFVKAIRYDGKDAYDQPVDIKNAAANVEVVLANRGASIAGTVADVRDRRADGVLVLLFRTPASKDVPPRLADSLTSASGTYSFGPLRDGEYSIVAVPADVAIPRDDDWDQLSRLVGLGQHITLGDMEQRTMDLRVTAVR
jgi:protocatechuate 3,4-dioxygenase beta subunit